MILREIMAEVERFEKIAELLNSVLYIVPFETIEKAINDYTEDRCEKVSNHRLIADDKKEQVICDIKNNSEKLIYDLREYYEEME